MEVAGEFSNQGKDRKRTESFMVLFDGRAVGDNVFHIEPDLISHLIGRLQIVVLICIFLLLGLGKAHLSLD
jgi:hypothetical protein